MDVPRLTSRRRLVVAIASVLALVAGVWPLDLGYERAGQVTSAVSIHPAPFPAALVGMRAALATNGRIYVYAGYGEGIPDTTIYEYDPAANSWAAKAPSPTSCQSGALASATNGLLYLVGNAPCTQTWAYDPGANTWAPRAPMAVPRANLALVGAPNGKLYAFGGNAAVTPLALVDEYDPIADTWTPKTPMPTARVGLSAVVANGGKIYVMGGGPLSGAPSLANDEYDPATDTWTARAPMPIGSSFGGAATLPDGRVYVAGGDPAPMTALQRFDPVTNTWHALRPLPGGRTNHGVAATPDGALLVIGGFKSGSNLASVLAYDPVADGWYPDDTPPAISSFQIAGGAAATNSQSVVLSLQASDVGSSVTAMRFSHDGVSWTAWEAFAPTKAWTLTAGEGPKAVHVQVRDGGENVSSPTSDSILYETVAPTLTSISINGGALASTSPSVTVALQATDEPGGSGLAGVAFSNDGGSSWSAWQPYAATTTWTLASGDGPKTVQARVRDAAGNESSVTGDQIALDTVPGTLYGVTIDDAAEWSNTTDVTLTIAAPPHTAEMMIANDGLFGGASWEPFSTTRDWDLIPFRPNEPITRLVYLRFRDVHGTVANGGNATIDDIVLDVGAPRAAVSVPPTQQPRAGRGGPRLVWTVSVTADDSDPTAERVSGVTAMRLANRPDFAGAVWQPYAAQVAWDFTGGTTVYAQVRDAAGNVSETASTSLPGAAPGPPGTSPAPVCSPRPPVTVTVQPENGTLVVTLAATGANNGLRAVRFDAFANAVVDVGEQRNQAAPFAVSIPPGLEPASLQFTVRRQAPGAATTVRLVVIDGCGEWSTFVGGGPNAF